MDFVKNVIQKRVLVSEKIVDLVWSVLVLTLVMNVYPVIRDVKNVINKVNAILLVVASV